MSAANRLHERIKQFQRERGFSQYADALNAFYTEHPELSSLEYRDAKYAEYDAGLRAAGIAPQSYLLDNAPSRSGSAVARFDRLVAAYKADHPRADTAEALVAVAKEHPALEEARRLELSLPINGETGAVMLSMLPR